jgi:hypothetical protein
VVDGPQPQHLDAKMPEKSLAGMEEALFNNDHTKAPAALIYKVERPFQLLYEGKWITERL